MLQQLRKFLPRRRRPPAAPYVHPRLAAIEHEVEWLKKPMREMTDQELMAIVNGTVGNGALIDG
jgi:hypothetical protein